MDSLDRRVFNDLNRSFHSEYSSKFFANLPPFFPRNGGRPDRGGNTVLENGQLKAALPDLP